MHCKHQKDKFYSSSKYNLKMQSLIVYYNENIIENIEMMNKFVV